MFKTIANLLFGVEEEKPEKRKEEEDWLFITHQEIPSAENQESVSSELQQSDSAVPENLAVNVENDNVDTVDDSIINTRSPVLASLSQPKLLPEVTFSQKVTKGPRLSRSILQRQNRSRQRVQPVSFHLQQPGHRSLSH